MKSIIQWLTLFVFAVSFPARSLVVLQYHHISDSTPASTSLSPELFKQHIDYLKDNDFKVLALSSVMAAIEKGESLPNKSVVITFDDGYRSVYTNAFPILKQYNFPFTVFVNTQPITQKLNQFMTWNELQELIDAGADVGNHSVNHLHLIPQHFNDEASSKNKLVENEITRAQSTLEKNLSKVIKAFAYPYGEFNQQSKEILKSLGFIAFGQHSGAFNMEGDLQQIPRFPFGGNYGDIKDFALKINSLPMPIKAASLLDQTNIELYSHLLDQTHNMPKLKLTLEAALSGLNITCFSSSGEELKSEVGDKGSITFSPSNPISKGRSRYNCTAPSSQTKRYYWFSQPLIYPYDNGNYY